MKEVITYLNYSHKDPFYIYDPNILHFRSKITVVILQNKYETNLSISKSRSYYWLLNQSQANMSKIT